MLAVNAQVVMNAENIVFNGVDRIKVSFSIYQLIIRIGIFHQFKKCRYWGKPTTSLDTQPPFFSYDYLQLFYYQRTVEFHLSCSLKTQEPLLSAGHATGQGALFQ